MWDCWLKSYNKSCELVKVAFVDQGHIEHEPKQAAREDNNLTARGETARSQESSSILIPQRLVVEPASARPPDSVELQSIGALAGNPRQPAFRYLDLSHVQQRCGQSSIRSLH